MRRKTRKNAGIIGLGIIGSRAAAGLRAAGFQVYVWNRTPKPVPNFLASPAEVAEVCDIVQLFVADAPALMQVLAALRPKLTAEHTIVCSATIGPESTLEAAKYVEESGARFLDAPFTGSKAAAERSQLVYYVGGDEATYLRAKPVLEAVSKGIVRCGGIGDAALLKVVTNQIAAVSIQVLAEALSIVRKAGLPGEILATALEHNGCRSGTMELKLPKMLSGDYEPHFSLKHMFKDVKLAIDLANAFDLDTPATAVTAGRMFGAAKRGWDDLDFSVLYKLYGDGAAPVELPAPGTAAPRHIQAENEAPALTAEPAAPPANPELPPAGEPTPAPAPAAAEGAALEALPADPAQP